MLLRTFNDYSKRYLVCQFHWTYLASDGVNTLKFIVRLENDMNAGDEVNNDVPKKKKKSTYLILNNERKKNVLGCMAYGCNCWLGWKLKIQPDGDHGWSTWFFRIKLEKRYRLMYKSTQIVHHTLHISRKKNFLYVQVIGSSSFASRSSSRNKHGVFEMGSGEN